MIIIIADLLTDLNIQVQKKIWRVFWRLLSYAATAECTFMVI